MTVADAIAKAGGLTSLSRGWQVVLVRKVKKGSRRAIVDYDAITNNEIPDVPLQAGDRIWVPQRPF
jgi:polysaccharide export outer membrane protein